MHPLEVRPRGRAAGPGSPDVLGELSPPPKRSQKLGFFFKKQSLPAFITIIFKAFGVVVVVLLSGHATQHTGC